MFVILILVLCISAQALTYEARGSDLSNKKCGTSIDSPHQNKTFSALAQTTRSHLSTSTCEKLTFNVRHMGLKSPKPHIPIYYTDKALRDLTRAEKDLVKYSVERWNQFYQKSYKTNNVLFTVHEEVKKGDQYVIINTELQDPRSASISGSVKWDSNENLEMLSPTLIIYLEQHKNYCPKRICMSGYKHSIKRLNFIDTVMHELGHILSLKHRGPPTLMNAKIFDESLSDAQVRAELIRHHIRVNMGISNVGGFGGDMGLQIRFPTSVSITMKPKLSPNEFEKIFNSIAAGLTQADLKALKCVIPAH